MPQSTERRASAIAPALSTDSKHIEGRAAVFYNPADPGTEYVYRMTNPQNPKGEPIEVRERIFPGAFTRALAEDEVVCYYNHEHNIGRRVAGDPANTMELSVDAQGLNYRTLLPDHMWGQMVREAVTRKDVRGSSFQFAPRPGGVTWRQEGTTLVRELRELFLFDASPVDNPAYKSTTADLRAECRAEERDAIVPLLNEPDSAAELFKRQRQWDADRVRAMNLQVRLTELRADEASYAGIRQQLWSVMYDALNSYDWEIVTVFQTYFVYEAGPGRLLYKQSYAVSELGVVSLTGDPQRL